MILDDIAQETRKRIDRPKGKDTMMKSAGA